MTVNESERNPLLVSLERQKSKERKSLAKESQESSSSLISKVHPKNKKKSRRRESSTDNSSLREVYHDVILYPAKRKYMVRGEDEIIMQLLGIHSHLMEMIQITYNMQGLKQ